MGSFMLYGSVAAPNIKDFWMRKENSSTIKARLRRIS